MRITHTHSGYQRGAALFMSLIFLLIMTILGVFGMNISRMENLMAGNNQFQAQALNDSELALREIEVITLGITEDGAPDVPNFDLDDQYHNAGDIDSSALDWSSVDHGTTTNGSVYVVEYEPTVWNGCSAAWGSSCVASLFRITTQTTSSKGARRTTQVVYGTNEAP
jgi:Tfp pilus assembly protein PilX